MIAAHHGRTIRLFISPDEMDTLKREASRLRREYRRDGITPKEPVTWRSVAETAFMEGILGAEERLSMDEDS